MTHSNGNGQGTGEPPVVVSAPPAIGGAADDPAVPAQVREFASALVEFVRRALGVTLDYTEETLPVVDHYLEQARRSPPQRGTAELGDLLAPAAGCYFGEVLRRKFGAHWLLDGTDPSGWRLGLVPCYLALHPVAMGACALAGGEVEGLDDSFATSERETAALTEALDAAAPIDEDTYYSLGGRMDVIAYAADFLMAYAIEQGLATRYPAAAYTDSTRQ
jgi:hypothetical protein